MEQFVVPNGNRRHFLVEANDASGIALYSGENNVDLAGTPVSVQIIMTPLFDSLPPVFSGTKTATYPGGGDFPPIHIAWEPAVDNFTPPESMVYFYYIYPYDSEGSPTAADIIQDEFRQEPSIVGETSIYLTTYSYPFDCDHDYWVIIKARDQEGNVSTNIDMIGPLGNPDGC